MTIIGEAVVDNTKWYKISLPSGQLAKEGYVSSLYIKLNLEKSIKANISSKSKYRKAVGDKAAYLKMKSVI